jgi:hypothetical protein
MLIKRLTTFITAFYTSYWGRVFLLTAYYFAIIAGLVILYGEGDFTPPDFVYQGF